MSLKKRKKEVEKLSGVKVSKKISLVFFTTGAVLAVQIFPRERHIVKRFLAVLLI